MTKENGNIESLLKAILKIKNLQKPHTFLDSLNMGEMSVFWSMRKITEADASVNEIKISRISSMLHISKPALSQIINRLESKDLIERTFSKADRRCTYLKFTENGKNLFDKEKSNMQECLLAVENKMGADSMLTLANLLEQFAEKLEEVRKEKQAEINNNLEINLENQAKI